MPQETLTVQEQAAIRRSLSKGANNQFDFQRMTEFGSAAMQQIEPPYVEMTRAGRRFHGALATLTGRAPVQAIPTTTATVFLYNGEAAGGRNYYIDYLNVICASGTPGAGCGLLGIMTKPTGTAPTQGANYTINNCNPNSNQRSNAILAEAYTIPTVDTSGVSSWKAWCALAALNFPAAAFQGGGDASDAYRDGRFCIPPGWGLGLAFLSATGTTPLFGVMVGWSELENTTE